MMFTFGLLLPDGVELQPLLLQVLRSFRGPGPYEVLIVKVKRHEGGWRAHMWLNHWASPKLMQAETLIRRNQDRLELTVEPHRVSEEGTPTHVFCDLWFMTQIANSLSQQWQTPVMVLGESFEALEELDVEITPEAMPFYQVCAGED